MNNTGNVLRIRATQVTSEACDDENIAYVFFQGDALRRKHYLMISRSLGSKKKSGVFLEYNDQGQVTVDGISRYRLHEHNLRLEIPSEAARELGLPEVRQIVVDFELQSASLSKLRDSLAAIFSDSGVMDDQCEG